MQNMQTFMAHHMAHRQTSGKCSGQQLTGNGAPQHTCHSARCDPTELDGDAGKLKGTFGQLANDVHEGHKTELELSSTIVWHTHCNVQCGHHLV